MCINVIQLKLEKLFEELILTLMEEYSSTSPEAQRLKEGRLGLMEMWRVWKKRKERLRSGLQRAATTRQFNYRQAAERAGENIAKIFPFSWRRERRHLIEEFQKRLRRKDKATQTDDPMMPTFEDTGTETSDVDSFCTNHTCPVLLIPDGPVCGPSRCESRPVVAQQEPSICSSSSHPTTGSIALSVPIGYDMGAASSSRYSPPSKSSLSTYSIHQCSSSSSRSGSASASVPSSSRQGARSAPSASPARPPIDFDPSRRWTFVATHNTMMRGAPPRGLHVPYMYTSSMSNVVHTNEIQRLISEIEARVQVCRALNSSRGTTPPNSIRASISGKINDSSDYSWLNSGTSLTRSIVPRPRSPSPSPSLHYPPPLPIPDSSHLSATYPIMPSIFRSSSGNTSLSFRDADA
ncbi:hypothetical protein WR25_01445 [Diploscapter pachys]|uniref:Uncharacterized protein n=1 Tax=Diploscapter pachys TaxID=2018661 RepID=A0A2A2KJ66_9BILA|nr:hypothetical protein WR25_01445 [Diploscapter pachys]